jgi:hypothetical protein
MNLRIVMICKCLWRRITRSRDSFVRDVYTSCGSIVLKETCSSQLTCELATVKYSWRRWMLLMKEFGLINIPDILSMLILPNRLSLQSKFCKEQPKCKLLTVLEVYSIRLWVVLMTIIGISLLTLLISRVQKKINKMCKMCKNKVTRKIVECQALLGRFADLYLTPSLGIFMWLWHLRQISPYNF